MPSNETRMYFFSNQWFDDLAHPRLTKYYPGGPWDLCVIVGVYLYVVLKAGPTYMAHRKPYDLVTVMKLYNIVNVLANVVLFVTWMYYTRGMVDCWMCRDASMPEWVHYYVSFGYLYLKIFDLLDTIFFVLRKKQRQITALHLIHHSILPFTVYGAIKFAPTSTTYMSALLNTAVHIFMYSYYYISADPDYSKWSQKLKRYITLIQLFQFVLVLAQATQLLYLITFSTCRHPFFFAVIQLLEGGYFLVEFGRFYVRAYRRSIAKNE